MTEFYPGQKVFVKSSTYCPEDWTRKLVGKVVEIRSCPGGVIVSVWTEDKSDFWFFRASDLIPIDQRLTNNQEITQDGKKYRVTLTEIHEYKFGDKVRIADEAQPRYMVGEFGVIGAAKTSSDGRLRVSYNDNQGRADFFYISPIHLTPYE